LKPHKHIINSIAGCTLLGVVYILLSLVIGEVHPFTTVPMYNKFPNYAYAYYVSDENGKMLPVGSYFNYNAGNLSHNYVAICESKKIIHGYEVETQDQLSQVGKEMLEQLIAYRRDSIPAKILQMHRVNYFLEKDSIKTKDVVMYGMEIK
jgi:hypothetical protein